MDKDRIKGKANQAVGRLQQAKGDITDNPKDNLKGSAKVAKGKVQEQIGKGKDAIRKAIK